MQKRTLGKTGEELSVIGFGGILVMDEDEKTSASLVAEAIDRGINYFDVAPSYGNAQERLGPALQPYRNDVFLACKTQERSAKEARRELEESLRILRTEHIDLYQLHAMTTMDDVEEVFSPGGAMETFTRAREEGLIRYIGFSAHSQQAALALLDRYHFDSMLFPVNWVLWFQGQFGPAVLEKAISRGTGILALKAMAKRKVAEGEARSWPKSWYHPVESASEANDAVRFTLTQPVTAAVTPGHVELFRWACDAAENFVPMSKKEQDALYRRSEGLVPLFSA